MIINNKLYIHSLNINHTYIFSEIKLVHGELSDANIEIQKYDLTINKLRSKILTFVVDFKKGKAFKWHIESRRQ